MAAGRLVCLSIVDVGNGVDEDQGGRGVEEAGGVEDVEGERERWREEGFISSSSREE